MRYRLATVIVVGLLVVASGCIGFPSGSQPVTESPRLSPTAACHDFPVPYNVSVPAEPENLTDGTAVALVKGFDRRFEVAKAKADFDNITVDTSVRELDVQRIDGGFEVTITTQVQISGDDLHGKWAYPTTYQITDRAFKREGATLKCW